MSYPEQIFRLLGRAEEGARIGPVTLYVDDLRTIVEAAVEDIPIAGMRVIIQRRDTKDELLLRIAGHPADPVNMNSPISTASVPISRILGRIKLHIT